MKTIFFKFSDVSIREFCQKRTINRIELIKVKEDPTCVRANAIVSCELSHDDDDKTANVRASYTLCHVIFNLFTFAILMRLMLAETKTSIRNSQSRYTGYISQLNGLENIQKH